MTEFVNTWSNVSGDNSATSLTVTLGSAATAGNWLFACITVYNGGSAFGIPTGWEKIPGAETLGSDTDPDVGGSCFYRKATGDSNNDFPPTWTTGGRCSALVVEIAGLDTTDPVEGVSGTLTDGTSFPSGNAAATSEYGDALTFLSGNQSSLLVTNVDGTDLSTSVGYSENVYAISTVGSHPVTAAAVKTYTESGDYSSTWSTTDTGCPAFSVCITLASATQPATGPWTLSGIDAEQVDRGDGVLVTKLTATANNGTATGHTNTLASGTHTTKWDIERDTGTGDIDLSIDGGSTWVDVTGDVGSSSYGECFVEDTLADPQIAIRLATSGDIVYVKNAALVPNCTEAELTGVDTPVTGEAGVKTYVQTPVVQTGEWSGDSWSAITAHPTISYRMDEGSGNTFLARDGDGTLTPAYDATIANVNSGSGGGWNRRD